MVHQVDEFVIIPDVTAHIMGFRIMRFQLFHDHAPHVCAVGSQGAGEPRGRFRHVGYSDMEGKSL
jgi:hypothetical protein